MDLYTRTYTYIQIYRHIYVHIIMNTYILILEIMSSYQSLQFQCMLTGFFLPSLIPYLYIPSSSLKILILIHLRRFGFCLQRFPIERQSLICLQFKSIKWFLLNDKYKQTIYWQMQINTSIKLYVSCSLSAALRVLGRAIPTFLRKAHSSHL